MNRQQLRHALSRSFEIDREFFRSFSMWDRLEKHEPVIHEQYKLQLDTVWGALKEHTDISDYPALVSFRRAFEQLAD